jgi:hypothetical protein
MEFTSEIKKQIVEGFIDIISRLASKSYQKRIWIKGEGPEMDAFDDAVCDYFGQCESILANYKYFGINEFQYNLLKNFKIAFENFSDKNDYPELFIDSPEWMKITEMAKAILKAFNCKKFRN